MKFSLFNILIVVIVNNKHNRLIKQLRKKNKNYFSNAIDINNYFLIYLKLCRYNFCGESTILYRSKTFNNLSKQTIRKLTSHLQVTHLLLFHSSPFNFVLLLYSQFVISNTLSSVKSVIGVEIDRALLESDSVNFFASNKFTFDMEGLYKC